MSGRVPPSMNSAPRRPAVVQPRLFRQQRFWMQLAAYRPLAVLASIWIGLLAIALFAYGQLMQATTDGQESTLPTERAEVYPHERMNQAAENNPPAVTPPDAAGDRDTTPVATEVSDFPAVNGLSGWTLVALVGGCAGGCWLLSVLIKMPRRTKRRPAKRRMARQQQYRLAARDRRSKTIPAAAAPRPEPETVPKLDVYDPEQPLVAPTQRSPQTAPPPTSPPPTSVAEPDVTVVSDQLQHRLDWPHDSLVNTADVRQRRSLSSYL